MSTVLVLPAWMSIFNNILQPSKCSWWVPNWQVDRILYQLIHTNDNQSFSIPKLDASDDTSKKNPAAIIVFDSRCLFGFFDPSDEVPDLSFRVVVTFCMFRKMNTTSDDLGYAVDTFHLLLVRRCDNETYKVQPGLYKNVMTRAKLDFCWQCQSVNSLTASFVSLRMSNSFWGAETYFPYRVRWY